tara:strand:+ start:164 stop:1498 length:1335 start_codon:yes stop_codon:yes gene_type:complete
MATYLYRDVNQTATNHDKCTISMWVKKTVNGTEETLISGHNSDYSRFKIRFRNDDKLDAEVGYGGSWYSLITNRIFRDSNAWIHIVMAYDTSQGTASDRAKMYINGVQETSFATENYPPQNNDIYLVRDTAKTAIGRYYYNGNYYGQFTGLMSHVHVVDGTMYDASAFGSTDSTTGEWKINTSPSITMGNNGFTVLKDGITYTDQSANSNNFTLSGTLTKTEDCPSDNFSTLISIYQSNPTGGFTNSLTTAISNDDSTWRSAFSSIATPPSGKYYCELKWSSGSHLIWGAVSAPTTAKNNFKDLTDSYTGEYISMYGANWYNKNSSQGTYESGIQLTSGNIGMMAIDRDNNKIWWGLNGAWGGSQNPATNTGGQSLPGDLDEFWHFAISTYSNSGAGVYQFNYGNGYFGTTQITSEGTNASGIGKFEFNVPSGFTALSTKGLNE